MIRKRRQFSLVLSSLILSAALLSSCGVSSSQPNSTVNGSSVGNSDTSSGSVSSPVSSLDSSSLDNPATSLYYNEYNEITIQKGKTVTLDYVVTPSTSSVSFSSNNESVATVDSVGKVTGIKSGVSYITVSTSNGLKDVAEVTVYDTTLTSGYDVTYTGTDPDTHVAGNISEAAYYLNSATLNHYGKVNITFNFNNTTTADDFITYYPELDSIASYSAYKYSKGTNLTNTFTITSADTNIATVHGKQSAYYPDITYGNKELSTKTMTHRNDDFESFPLDQSNLGSHEVSNPEELWYCVNQNYAPTFKTEGTKAQAFYEQARDILRYIVNDEMDDFDKIKAIYDWLTTNTFYDYYASDTYKGNWYRNTAYYLDGIFQYRNAVCDGFSKTIALMAGIENLDVVRAYGYDSSEAGHAWNYIKLENEWYLVCGTWGQYDMNTKDDSDIDIYDTNVGLVDYSAFLTKATYFNAVGDYYPVQKIYPETLNADSFYPLALANDDIKGTDYDFYIESSAEFEGVLKAVKDNNITGDFYLNFQDAGSNVTSAKAIALLNKLQISYSDTTLFSATPYKGLTYKTLLIKA